MKSKEIEIDFESSIGSLLGKTNKVIDYYLHEAIKSENLDATKEQIIILKKLFFNDGINQNELACLIFRNKSSLTRLLVKMEKKNYIKRKRSKEDKRNNNVFITALGKEIFIKTRPIIKKIMNITEQNISKEEEEVMIEVLNKIQTNFRLNLQTL